MYMVPNTFSITFVSFIIIIDHLIIWFVRPKPLSLFCFTFQPKRKPRNHSTNSVPNPALHSAANNRATPWCAWSTKRCHRQHHRQLTRLQSKVSHHHGNGIQKSCWIHCESKLPAPILRHVKILGYLPLVDVTFLLVNKFNEGHPCIAITMLPSS